MDMKIIFSPTKKMVFDDDIAYKGLPLFVDEAQVLLSKLRGMSRDELKVLYRCNDKILDENLKRIELMDLHRDLSCALFSYTGLAFQHLSPISLQEDELAYLQDCFRILSGFYGILKPMDGITPYRLEMQSVFGDGSSLYDFWQDKLYRVLNDDVIINLASKEYSKCIQPYLCKHDRMIDIVFGELKNGKLVTKATMAKMARGDMVWFMAKYKISNPEEIKKFDEHYRFDESLSDDTHFVFVYQG